MVRQTNYTQNKHATQAQGRIHLASLYTYPTVLFITFCLKSGGHFFTSLRISNSVVGEQFVTSINNIKVWQAGPYCLGSLDIYGIYQYKQCYLCVGVNVDRQDQSSKSVGQSVLLFPLLSVFGTFGIFEAQINLVLVRDSSHFFYLSQNGVSSLRSLTQFCSDQSWFEITRKWRVSVC